MCCFALLPLPFPAAFTIVYQVHQQAWIGLVVCAAVAIAATISLHLTCKQYNVPTLYGVPLFPYVPALSVAVNAFLLGQLQKPAYERFGIWTGFITREWLGGCLFAFAASVLPAMGNCTDSRWICSCMFKCFSGCSSCGTVQCNASWTL